jgi:putative membrane protein (TIGR04086 family)
MMKTVAEKQSANVKQLIKPALSGILCAFIVSVFLLAVFSALMAAKDMPSVIVLPFACISISIGALCGGFLASRLNNSRGLFLGVVTGLLFMIILYIAGAFMHQADLNMLLFLKIVLAAFFGAVGGITGVNLKRRRSRI